ncbi:MAG: hypothetical protein J0L87_09275 [Bacteroidetes bacterium]|nr:hypothetical protein [Bacteroidota bacterium]
MKPFSENSLKAFKLFSYLIASKKSIQVFIDEYNKVLNSSKQKFSKFIDKEAYYLDKPNKDRLIELYSTAVIFRSNKKFIKNIFDQIVYFLIIAGALLLPYFTTCYFYQNITFPWYKFLIIYSVAYLIVLLLGFVLINFFEIISKFEIKIGKALNNLIIFLLLGLFCYSGYWFYNSEFILLIGVFSGYVLLYLVIVLLVFSYILESIIDAYCYSNKIQITDALILESAYRLSLTNWNNAVKNKKTRQIALSEIERLSSLVEKDLSSHIVPGDEKTNKWKNNTLLGISTSIRKNKRKLIIPSINSPVELKAKFDLIFEKFLKNDFQGLVDSEVPVARIKKRSILGMLQSFIVAILPVSISFSMNYLPNGIIDSNYIHFATIIGCIWFLVSVLIWLDPNLSDKISAFKSVKDTLKSAEEN